MMLKYAERLTFDLGMRLGARLEVRLRVLLVAQLAVVPFEWVMMGKAHSATSLDGQNSMYPNFLHRNPSVKATG